MRRPGTDENNVQMSDVLCDFCHSPWSEDVPVIEGHQGSIFCAKCLSVAYAAVVLRHQNTAPAGYTCTMCLERRSDAGWRSPAYPEAAACLRCVELAATALEKDKDFDWKRPAG